MNFFGKKAERQTADIESTNLNYGIHHTRRGCQAKRLWTEEELIERWTLAPDELALLSNKSGRTPADPARLVPRLVGHARRLGAGEAPLEGRGGRADARLLNDLSGLGVQHARVAVAIPGVDAYGTGSVSSPVLRKGTAELCDQGRGSGPIGPSPHVAVRSEVRTATGSCSGARLAIKPRTTTE